MLEITMPILPRTAFISASIATALTGCSTLADVPTERLGSARISSANGIPIGTAQLLGSGDQLSLAVAVTGIDAGAHGFHLHTKGDCRRPDFSSAGGHLNPLGKSHGSESGNGSHIGDLPNLVASENGTASTTVDLVGNRAELIDYLFDDDGTAVVIHAGPDDYRSDPAGAAGPRIACGILTRG